MTKSSRVIKDPHTGNLIRVPAHFLAPERARGDMRKWLEQKETAK